MSKKYSFSEFPEFETKVKKEKTKKTTPQVNEAAQDQRIEKINFKSYLRNLKEEQAVDDEFADIAQLPSTSIYKETIDNLGDRLDQPNRILYFGTEDLNISEANWNDIRGLEKDDSITILDEHDDRWYISRTVQNHLVFESQEYVLSGKFKFDDFVRILK